MMVVCPICGISVEKSTGELKRAQLRGHKLYCSRRCASSGITKRKYEGIKCANCDCKQLLTREQWIQGNIYCSRSCAHTKINHSHSHSEMSRLRTSVAVKEYYKNPEALKQHRGKKNFQLLTGKVIRVDSLWEASLYEFLLAHCSYTWSYANETPFFIHLDNSNWLPDFVIYDFRGRKLVVEIKGHPNAFTYFESVHYLSLLTSEACNREFFVGILTVPPWWLKLNSLDDLLSALEWIIPPAPGLKSYIPRSLSKEGA